MRKSRSETVETKKRIIAAASKLFLERGLNSVGMRDVMEAAELTAGGFYRHFTSKDHLIAEAMRSSFDRLFEMFEVQIKDTAAVEALDRVVTLYLAQTRSGTKAEEPFLCPLAKVGSEFRCSAPMIRAVAIDGYERLASVIAACLPHTPKEHARIDSLAIVNALVGAETLAGLATSVKSASQIRAEARVSILKRYGDVRKM